MRIAPSILSTDFSRLGEQVRQAEAAGADLIHVDVMDGHFVPPITIGSLVVEALRRITRLPLDVHLMVEEPERQIDAFAAAGADMIIVHVEATAQLQRSVQQIRASGALAGVTLNPETSVDRLRAILPEIDQVLIMSVNPGWGGQPFIPGALERLRTVREWIDGTERAIALEIDGGVNEKTAAAVVEAGADLLVAGSAVFNERESVAEAMTRLRRAIGS